MKITVPMPPYARLVEISFWVKTAGLAGRSVGVGKGVGVSVSVGVRVG
jgi:hypothetical protein